MTKLIIAGSYEEAVRWCIECGLKFGASLDWAYCWDPAMVLLHDEYELVGTYEDRPDWETVTRMIDLRTGREYNPDSDRT